MMKRLKSWRPPDILPHCATESFPPTLRYLYIPAFFATKAFTPKSCLLPSVIPECLSMSEQRRYPLLLDFSEGCTSQKLA